MSPKLKALTAEYEESAREYLRNLPLEHFMEARPQATQRQITLASLELLVAEREDLHLFNEMLVQYRKKGQRPIEKVVPDNMIVRSKKKPVAVGSYDLEIEKVTPFWVLEYVSKNSQRKDYEDNFTRYEQDLKIPYYLIFYPDTQDLTLYHLRKSGYASVPPNTTGRHPLAELDVEVTILDGWVRFWFRDNLLSLPADLQRTVARLSRQLRTTVSERDLARQERDTAVSERNTAVSERNTAVSAQNILASERDEALAAAVAADARAEELAKRLAELQQQLTPKPRSPRKNGHQE